jgi:hypothetical protein
MEEGAQCACSFGARQTAKAFPDKWGLGKGWNLQPGHPRPARHLSRATVVHSTYSSEQSVRALLNNAATWPRHLATQIDLIIADDAGSPRAIAIVREWMQQRARDRSKPQLQCPVGVVTLAKDVGFNNGGVRNTACLASRTETVFLLDQDFGLRPRHLEQLLAGVPSVTSNPEVVWTIPKHPPLYAQATTTKTTTTKTTTTKTTTTDDDKNNSGDRD